MVDLGEPTLGPPVGSAGYLAHMDARKVGALIRLESGDGLRAVGVRSL